MRNKLFSGERFVTLLTLLVLCIMAAIAQATGEAQGWANVSVAYLAAVTAIGVTVPLGYQIVALVEGIRVEFRTAIAANFRKQTIGGWNVPDNVCPGCGRSFSMQSSYLLAKDDNYVVIMPECSEAWIANGWLLYHDSSGKQ
ncbi:MAG: hypothetical protein RI947_832 [Candidatus Parcubacteria bacterium]|jgi:hypothetical protein